MSEYPRPTTPLRSPRPSSPTLKFRSQSPLNEYGRSPSISNIAEKVQIALEKGNNRVANFVSSISSPLRSAGFQPLEQEASSPIHSPIQEQDQATSQPILPHDDNQSFPQRLAVSFRKHIINSPLKWIYLLVLISIIASILLIVFRNSVTPVLLKWATDIRQMGKLGQFLLGCLVFACSFPPMLGYGTLIYVCGFLFGFPGGILPAYFGALIGAVCCFTLSRRYFLGYRQLISTQYPQFLALESAVGDLKTMILIRLAPYPFSLLNVFFSTTNISFTTFFTATAIALSKNIVYVWIGSTIHDLADIHEGSPVARWLLLVFGILLVIGSLVWISRKVRNELASHQNIESQREQLLDDDVESDT